MIQTSTRNETINKTDFFAGILAAIDYSQPKPEVLRQRQAESLTQTINRVIEAGASFEVSSDGFEIIGTDYLRQSDRDFLSVNKKPILCTLQQSLLMKHLFSHAQHSFSDFAFEIAERESILTEAGAISYEAYFEAVREITEKWFNELLNNK